MKEYRIVTDEFSRFEVQHRRWWWPFWRQTGFSITHKSIEDAEAWIAVHWLITHNDAQSKPEDLDRD